MTSKFEEIYPAPLRAFVALGSEVWSAAQILSIEAHVLAELGFDLTRPTNFAFLQRFTQLADRFVIEGFRYVAELDYRAYSFALYFLECGLFSPELTVYPGSLLAAAAVYLADKISFKRIWTSNLQKEASYSETQVKFCAKQLHLTNTNNREEDFMRSMKIKFDSPKLMEVSIQ